MVDINKHRNKSSLNGMVNLSSGESYRKQSSTEFDMFQSSMPNTYRVYVNDSVLPTLATFTDVTENGNIIPNEKWILVSLKNDIKVGDIIKWNDKKWMVIMDKDKNTGNSDKFKIKLCNYNLNIPATSNNLPIVYTIPISTYSEFSDLKDTEIVPTNESAMQINIAYDNISNSLKISNRLWLYNDAWEIIGIDYTKLLFDENSNCWGYFVFTVKIVPKNELDNEQLKICDYYKYFSNKIEVPTTNSTITIVGNREMDTYSNVVLTTSNTANKNVIFQFVGDTLNCNMSNVTNNSCTINSKGIIGNVYIKAYIQDNPLDNRVFRITISNI